MNASLVVLLTFFLLLGSYSWGRVTVRSFKLDLVSFPSYLNLPIGFSVFLVFAGYLLFINQVIAWVCLLWFFVGVLLDMYLSYKDQSIKRLFSKSFVISNLMNTALIGLCTLFGLGITATRTFQLMDDYPTYLFFAQKIAATGGLIEPFNGSRLSSYGAVSVGQALYLKLTGVQSVFAFDALLGSLALVVLIIGVCKKYNISPLWKWVICVLALVGTSSTYNFNLSPWFWIIYLTVAGFFVLQQLLSSSANSDRIKLTALTAIVLSSLIDMRIDNAVCTVLAGVFITVIIDKRSFKYLTIFIGGIVISCSGWALAMYESSRSFLYPPMVGYGANGISGGTVTQSLSKSLSILISSIMYRNELVLLLIILGIYCYLLRRGKLKENAFKVLPIFMGGISLQLLVMVGVLKGFDPWMISRYFSSSVIALSICTGLLLLLREEPNSSNYSIQMSIKSFFNKLRAPLLTVSNNSHQVVVSILFAVSFMSFQEPLGAAIVTKPMLSTNFKSTWENLQHSFMSGLTSTHQSKPDPLSQFEANFSVINKSIPQGSRVLAAIETPGLLELKRFTPYSLGSPGNSSPFPGMPYDKGPRAAMSYLRSIGISYLVISSPGIGYGYYCPATYASSLKSKYRNYSFQGEKIFLLQKLFKNILTIHVFPTRFIGNFAIISTSQNSIKNSNASDYFNKFDKFEKG